MTTPTKTWPPTITSTTEPVDTEELRMWLREEHWANEVQRTFVIGLLAKIDALQAPVEMIMFCPLCNARHIDRTLADKPHKEHACQGCGFVWKPSRRHTVGVAYLPDYKDLEPKDVVWSSIPGPLELLERSKARVAASAAAQRIRDSGPHQPVIKDTGPAQPNVPPADVGRTLGADEYLMDPEIDIAHFVLDKCRHGSTHEIVTHVITGGGGWVLTCTRCLIYGHRKYQTQDSAIRIAGMISGVLGQLEASRAVTP